MKLAELYLVDIALDFPKNTPEYIKLVLNLINLNSKFSKKI